jgi:sigma54-dependent transcription regulator
MEVVLATGSTSATEPNAFAQRLAQFFPEASPVRIPVRITGTTISGKPFSERTTIEFGTEREVIFGSHLPLEFADTLRLENGDASLSTEVSVVAIHYYDGNTTAVAARFKGDVSNWIVKG